MNWILIFSVIAFCIYLVYNIAALSLFGVPKSLSMTYYLFKEKWSWSRCLFPIMMLSMAGLLMPAWIEMSTNTNFQFLAFLAAAGIIFTGAAPAFKSSELEQSVHMTSAVVAAICALLWVILVPHLWYVILAWFVVFAVAAYFTHTVKTSFIYWLETVAFLSTFTSVLIFYTTM